MRRLVLALATLLSMNTLPPAARADGLKAVVFDMEPANMEMTPALQERIRAGSALLRKLLTDRGLTIVDTAPQAKKIKDSLPLSQCNGCDQDIAKALGADVEIATAVQPLTSALFSLSGSVKDVRTNRALRAGVVNVSGEQADEWAHSVKFLVKERLFAPPLPADAAALRTAVEAAAKGK